MAQYKDDLRGTWYYSFIDKDGKCQKKRGFRTKSDAKKAEAERREQLKIEAGKYLTTVADEKLRQLKKKRTLGSYDTIEQRFRTLIKPFITNKLMIEYTVTDIDDFVASLQESGASNASVNKALDTLKLIFSFAIDHDYCVKNPVAKVDKLPVEKREMKVWNLHDFENAIQYEENLEYNAFFQTLYWTGMRKGEARALRWSDLDFRSNKLTINRHIDDKSGVEYAGRKNTLKHVIVIDDDLSELLQTLKKHQERKDGFDEESYVFGILKPLPTQSINNHFQAIIKKSGNERIRIHDLRHSHVSWLISVGCTPSEAAARIGDSVEQVYRTYAHFFDNQQETIADTINRAKKQTKKK